MEVGDGSPELEDRENSTNQHDKPQDSSPASPVDSGNSEDEDEEEEEEEEPRLKYAPLTRSLSGLYRNGDATSAFLVAGDKLVVGTHNGNIHVLSMPSLQTVKQYHAHSASVTAISISPYPPPLPVPTKHDAAQRLAAQTPGEQSPSQPPPSPKSPRGTPKQTQVPRLPSNEIYIATSSIDGNVCVQSLIDPKDVQLRNFGRPIQAVALSPEYRSDKSYLSGGQAGNLTLTIGGQSGKSANATTTGAAAAASGWLGSLGLGSNTGTDKVLHSGEGIISTIKWSLSGKYVLWVNEYGIKIMRSHLKLDNSDSNLEWKRISHIPRREKWGDEAAVQKARAEWIDRGNLEADNESSSDTISSTNGTTSKPQQVASNDSLEEVVVGWVDWVWVIKIVPATKPGSAGHAEVTASLDLSDCIISGVSMYTPSLLLVLAYMEKKESSKSKKSDDGTKKGRKQRRNALEPELRLIDIKSREEVETDTLSVSRFETLSSSDYHLGALYPIKIPTQLAKKGYLDQLGAGVSAVGSGFYQGAETVGQGVWDATMYGPKLLGANRLFSAGETGSVRSAKTGPETPPSGKGINYLTSWMPGFSSNVVAENEEFRSVASTLGMKIFIFSPFDCIVAVKRNLADRVEWFESMHRYQEAWRLIDEHPEAMASKLEPSQPSTPPSPSKASSFTPSGSIGSPTPAKPRHQQTLAEFFAESSSIAGSNKAENSRFSAAEKEKRRIGELWLQQLVNAGKWNEAGDVASKVLNTTSRWEYWVWKFIENKQFDAISAHVPAMELTPPLPSSIFEFLLGHYVSIDRKRFKELIDQWPSDLFEVSSVIKAVRDQLNSENIVEDSRDWQILHEVLAKLYLADGNYKEALKCYIRLQDAETAMSLIRDHHLVEVIADDVPSFVLLRISHVQLTNSPQQDLQELSSEPIKMLVDEATHGVVQPEEVVSQLEKAKLKLFLFFYLRALWKGEGTDSRSRGTRPRFGGTNLAADEGKLLVDQFADTAVELFAEFDRSLLMDFLHNSSAYTFEKALKICEQRSLIEEEVYLLSKTGSMKKALFLIIEQLEDVPKAIAFAKEQDDPGLWEDLLDYSMSRPKFISGLLAEVGTAVDPITLVKRIPSGIEIEGLKDGLKKMIREYDLQDSISSGVAQVLSSEVAVDMDSLRRGRQRGIKFDIFGQGKTDKPNENGEVSSTIPIATTGICSGCGKPFTVGETDILIGFACGHAYHLSHLFNKPEKEGDQPNPLPTFANKEPEEEAESFGFMWSVAPKVTTARLLRDKVESAGGCKVCSDKKEKVQDSL